MTTFTQHAAAALAAVLIMTGSFGTLIAVPQSSGQIVIAAPALA